MVVSEQGLRSAGQIPKPDDDALLQSKCIGECPEPEDSLESDCDSERSEFEMEARSDEFNQTMHLSMSHLFGASLPAGFTISQPCIDEMVAKILAEQEGSENCQTIAVEQELEIRQTTKIHKPIKSCPDSLQDGYNFSALKSTSNPSSQESLTLDIFTSLFALSVALPIVVVETVQKVQRYCFNVASRFFIPNFH